MSDASLHMAVIRVASEPDYIGYRLSQLRHEHGLGPDSTSSPRRPRPRLSCWTPPVPSTWTMSSKPRSY
jgi:hypothetical protein